MSLRAHLTALDFGAVLGQLAALVRMMGWLLLLPAALGFLSREFLVAGVLSGLSVVALALGHWGRTLLPKDLHLREAFVVTALAYPLFALAGAIAFLPVAPFIDGFFESMSGFTTTGLSVLQVNALPKSLRFFRAYMQWIGGVGIVILSVAVWNATRPAGFRFRMYGSAPEGERLAASVRASGRQLVVIYGLVTAAVCVAFIVAGMSVEDAVLHGLATISTGGFSPHAESIGHFASNPLVLALTLVGMLLGATSFGNYQRLAGHSRTDGHHRDPQLLALAGIVLAGALLLLCPRGTALARRVRHGQLSDDDRILARRARWLVVHAQVLHDPVDDCRRLCGIDRRRFETHAPDRALQARSVDLSTIAAASGGPGAAQVRR